MCGGKYVGRYRIHRLFKKNKIEYIVNFVSQKIEEIQA
jgi:hypothetical protein